MIGKLLPSGEQAGFPFSPNVSDAPVFLTPRDQSRPVIRFSLSTGAALFRIFGYFHWRFPVPGEESAEHQAQ